MNSFKKITETELQKVVMQLNSSTCVFIPTAFFKEVFDTLCPSVLDIVNRSLGIGTFPDTLKTAVVRPLLKKQNLLPSVLSNYRPISNLPSLSKIMEK